MDGSFTRDYSSTLGVDLSIKKVTHTLEGRKEEVTLQIWDLAGQALFTNFRKNYLAGAEAILFVYDITDPASFNNIMFWLHESFEVLDPAKVSLVVIGNKIDKIPEKVISIEQATLIMNMIYRKYPTLKQSIHLFTSAKTGYNIDKAFESVLFKRFEVPLLSFEHPGRSAHA